MGVLKYPQEVHQLKMAVIAAIPFIARGKVAVERRIDLAKGDAKANGVARMDIHQLAPQPCCVLTQLDYVEQGRLYKRVQEVNEIVIVAVKKDV